MAGRRRMTIKVDAPKSVKIEQTELTEQEAYKVANKINKEDNEHLAKVENGKLKVQQVLKG
jgi:sRNA-binding carbon storage regulator CsrA